MTLDIETKALLTEAIDEAFEAFVDDQAIKFWEGGIVRTAPTGAPPQYIQVEIEGFYDQNVMWRGVPASLQVGDEVLVWENPRTHRREVLGGSGLTKPSTSTPWQKVTVAISGGDFALPSAAIAWINALPVGVAPSATRLFAINILGGTFVDSAAHVTIPQYVHVGGEGEGTVWDLGDYTLIFEADTSLQEIIVTSTSDEWWYVIDIDTADNVVLDDVRVILTGTQGGWQECFYIEHSDNVELYHVICESTTADNVGFDIYHSTVLLWDCKAEDETNFILGLLVSSAGNPSTVTTKFCEFRATGAGNDVEVIANNTWYHFVCQFSPDNSTIAGTEVPLPHGKTNFDDEVYVRELQFDAATILTIDAAGTVTVTQSYHSIAANAGVADNLDQIDGGGPARNTLVIRPDAGDTITVRHNAGGAGDNIWLAGGNDLILDSDNHLLLFWDGALWCDVSGGAGGGGAGMGQADILIWINW